MNASANARPTARPGGEARPSGDLSIGEVAAWAEVATSTLRYWEEQGLLRPVRRSGGRRSYDGAALDRVSLILLAQRAGFTLGEIRQLLTAFPPRTPAGERWRSLVDRKQAEVAAKIEELRRMLGVLELLERCGCPDLDACGAATRARDQRLAAGAAAARR